LTKALETVPAATESFINSRRAGVLGSTAYTRDWRAHGVGPTPVNILSMVLGHGMLTIAVGVAIGLIGSLLLTRTLRSLLFGVSPNEAMPASYIPARRATRVDPMVALRQSKRAAR